MVDTKKVGVFIAQCRKEHNWTQKELGEKLGVTDKANRAVLVWRGAVSAGLVSTADRAYMKAPVHRPTLRLVDKVSRSCGYTPGKVTGQRVTVKAEMNGFTPGLDRRPPSH